LLIEKTLAFTLEKELLIFIELLIKPKIKHTNQFGEELQKLMVIMEWLLQDLPKIYLLEPWEPH